jgi:hypothetical protein
VICDPLGWLVRLPEAEAAVSGFPCQALLDSRKRAGFIHPCVKGPDHRCRAASNNVPVLHMSLEELDQLLRVAVPRWRGVALTISRRAASNNVAMLHMSSEELDQMMRVCFASARCGQIRPRPRRRVPSAARGVDVSRIASER